MECCDAVKVIQIVPDISNEASGPSYSVLRLSQSLAGIGVDTTLVTLQPPGREPGPAINRQFPLWGPRRLGASPRMRQWLHDQAGRCPALTFHNHSLWMMPNVYPGQAAQKYGIPYVVSPRGTFTEYALSIGSRVKIPFWHLVQRPALNSVTCFHATALSEYEDIRRMGFRQPVTVIPNGIDVPANRQPSRTRKRTALFLGRVHPNKGVDILVLAWNRLQARFPDWSLRIVGPDEGGHLAEIEALVSAMGISRVSFDGPLFGNAKQEAYSNADLFVLPSHSENFGMSVAEALAAGVPSIVAKGAPWSGLEEKGAGRWIDLGVDAFEAAMADLMSLPDARLRQMGAAGRQWMVDEFGWHAIAQAMFGTYDWLRTGGCPPSYIILD
jgi:glycosyltransferase involved in cell wall biosynthesis